MPGGKHVLGQSRDRHIFGTVKVGEKGQIVIPKEARLQGIQLPQTVQCHALPRNGRSIQLVQGRGTLCRAV